MRTRLAILLCCVLLSFSMARSEIGAEPDYTFLWNNFDAVTVVDSFAIVTNANGIAVLLRDGATGQYNQVNQEFLTARGLAHKVRDSILAVRTSADVIFFFDLAQLPAISLIGAADVGHPFLDFAWDQQDLYVAMGFDGLWRYRMTSYSDPRFTDSSMLGIHYVKVDTYGDGLYALDDYNGILRYDISGEGFGTFQDYLLIPFQATSFERLDSTFYIPTTGSQLLVGRFGSGSPVITDTVSLWYTAHQVFVHDTLAAVLTKSMGIMDVINLNTLDAYSVQLQNMPNRTLQGSIYVLEGKTRLMLSTRAGGLDVYNLTDIRSISTPTRALARPGSIADVVLRDSTLLTAGFNSPLDRYRLRSGFEPVYDTTFYGGIPEVRAMENNGDTLFVYYSGLGRIFMVDTESDSLAFLGSIRPFERDIRHLIYNSYTFDSLHPLFAVSDQTVEVFSASDSGGLFGHQSFSVVDEISSAAVRDSTFYLATSKTGVSLYHIFSDLDLEFRSNISLIKPARHLAVDSDRLFVFTTDQMIVYRITNSSNPVLDTVLSLPAEVTDSDVDHDILYTVGRSGIALWNLATEHPELIDYGGRPGYMIAAANNGIVATSDSNAINLYDLRDIATDVPEFELVLPTTTVLHQNYPNPFNPTTTISYSLAVESRVTLDVYNLLGQLVRRLVDTEQPAGDYLVVWDGAAADGRQAATGVYFYRLTAGDIVRSRKMLLLK